MRVHKVHDVQATADCSEPEDYNEDFLIERCNEGHYLIDKETGEKEWTGTADGMGKACSKSDVEGSDLETCIIRP
jgi:hypothetical protein